MRIIKNNSNAFLSQQEISNLDNSIYSMTGSEILVYDYIQGMNNITVRIIISQTYLAKKLGLCRATINRALKRLAELNLLQKIDRGWKEDRTRTKKTCFYIVSKLFDLPEIRKRYQHKFKSLLYLKLVGKFEDLIESGFKHYDRIVTGIKSSLNCLFINRSLGSLGPKGYRRSNHSNLTIEEGSKKMSEFISTLGGFNEEAKAYLSAYDEEVVKEAIRCLGRRVPTGNQFNYFSVILNRISQERQKQPDKTILQGITGKPQLQVPITSPFLVASSPKPFYKKGEQEKKHVSSTAERKAKDDERRAREASTIQEEVKITALELAHRIATLKEQAEKNAFLREILPDNIAGLINCGYRTTGEFNEDKALYYLEMQRTKFNIKSPEASPVLKDPSLSGVALAKTDSNPQSLGNLINQVMPEQPKALQKGEMLNNGQPLPERLEMLIAAQRKLGLPEKLPTYVRQEPSVPTTVIPVNTVAIEPVISESVRMIKDAFPNSQLVQLEPDKNEPEPTNYDENYYEEVFIHGQ